MRAKTRDDLYASASKLSCVHSGSAENGVMYRPSCCPTSCMAWREREITLPVPYEKAGRAPEKVWEGWCGLAGAPAQENDFTLEDSNA